MRTIIIAVLSAFILSFMPSCSFVKDVQSHCTVSQKSLDVYAGSFETCLTCDSLAKVVKSQIAKAQNK